MRCVRAGAAMLLWVCGAVAMSGCANLLEAGPPAPVALPPAPAPEVLPPAPPEAEDYSPPSAVGAEMARWFAAAGYKRFQVAALITHARIESGLHPCASPHSALRYTFQWGGVRLRRLQQFAHSGGSCPPLDTQLAFADRELRSEPSYACFWRATSEPSALAALRRGFGGGHC